MNEIAVEQIHNIIDDVVRGERLGVQNVFVCPPRAELPDTGKIFAERYVRA